MAEEGSLMATYKDQLLKAAYYKEQVIKEMIKKGVFPDDRTIQDRVNRIDKLIAIFSHKNIKPGEMFDVNKFQQALLAIYQDLQFLYRLLYETSVKEYEYVRSYVDAHLKELERLSERYKMRSRLEIDTTSLGKTILFQNSGFEVFNRDNATYVDLGPIDVKEGSTLAVIFDADNANAKEALFGLEDSEGKIIYVSPYNYMQDILKVPGKLQTETYLFNMDEQEIVISAFKVRSEGLEPTAKNEYLIFGGENRVFLREPVRRRSIAVDENNAFYIREAGLIEFYIYKGTYANFNFTRQPEGKNFKGNSIENLSDYHYVAIRSDEGELAFNLLTDGKVFAVMRQGIVKDGELYFPEETDARSFLIEEVRPGNTMRYNAFLKVISNNEEPVRINSVAVKELNALEVAQR